MKKVTDPALLAQLNGGNSAPDYSNPAVVNKAVLDLYGGGDEPPAASPSTAPAATPARKKVTDPALLAQLDAAPVHNGRSFLQTAGDNFRAGKQAVGDLIHGDFETPFNTRPTPKTQALGDKLFPEGSMSGTTMENIGDFLMNLTQNVKSSDVSGAVLEKFGDNPAGKAVTAIGGLNPVYNAANTAVEKYVNPAIESTTGIAPENLQLAELAAAPLGLKKAGSVNDPLVTGVKNAGSNIARNTGEIRAGARARTTDELNADQASMERTAGDTANAMRAGNVTLTPQATAGLVRGVQSVFAKPENELFADSHPKTSEILNQLISEASQGPLRLNSLNNMRERLVNEPSGSDSAMAGKMRTAMMDNLQNLTQQDIGSGDPAAVAKLGEFLNQWKQAKRFEDVAGLVNTAHLAPNVADALQRTFGRFVKDDHNTANFSPEEKALMQQVAEKGMGDSLMKLVGSIGLGPNNKLIPVLTGMAMYGGGMGAIPTAIATTVAAATRAARNNAVRGRAENVLSAIESRDTSAPQPANVPPATVIPPGMNPTPSGGPSIGGPPPLLTSRQPSAIVVDWNGNARPQTAAEMFMSDAARSRAENLGATPDVVNAWDQNRAAATNPGMVNSEMGKAAAGQYYRPMGDWLGLNENNADTGPMLREMGWQGADRDAAAAEAAKAGQVDMMHQQNTPDIGSLIMDSLQGNNDKAAATGGQFNLGAIGQALLDAFRNSAQQPPKRQPLKITISNDPNIGPDGLPRVDLPEGR